VSGPEDSLPPAREKINFATFVLSMSAAALQNMGVPVAEGTNPCVNLALARESIEVLEMLQKKTTGNLTEEESNLLNAVLYDLRMTYVRRMKETGCTEG